MQVWMIKYYSDFLSETYKAAFNVIVGRSFFFVNIYLFPCFFAKYFIYLQGGMMCFCYMKV